MVVWVGLGKGEGGWRTAVSEDRGVVVSDEGEARGEGGGGDGAGEASESDEGELHFED